MLYNKSSDGGSFVGKNCPYCQTPIKPGANIVSCPACGIFHHEDCWRDNGNKCTTFGCGGVINRVNTPTNFTSPSYDARNTQVSATQPPKQTNFYLWALLILIAIAGLVFGTTNFSKSSSITKDTGANSPQVTPTQSPTPTSRETPTLLNNVVRQTVVDFYENVARKNYSTAWNYLSDDWKQSSPYSKWVQGYNNTISTRLDSAEVIGNVTENDDKATVRVGLTARDRESGRILVQTFAGNITVIKRGGKWSLDESSVKRLNYWYE